MSSSSMLQQLIDKGLSVAEGLSVSTDTRKKGRNWLLLMNLSLPLARVLSSWIIP